MSKIFIIGLPRTGTTSISVALLEMGLTVAHTAFTKKAFEVADAVSDAPCFSDYMHLDQLFPNSKFIYLTRELDSWLPSITMLLGKMAPHLVPKFGKFHPILKRSFHHTFSVNLPLTELELTDCYHRHQRAVLAYFKDREDFLTIDVSHQGSIQKMAKFLGLKTDQESNFPKLNVGRNVASWKEYKHKSKVSANLAGIEHQKYFDYVLGDKNN